MTNFEEITPIKFELTNTLTWGVVVNEKYGGYTIPIALGNKSATKIRDLAKKHGTKDPVYKTTMYLKSKKLTEKQTKELLNKGRCHVTVHFTATGVYTNPDSYVRYLVTKVTKLAKVDEPQPDSDSCPEDQAKPSDRAEPSGIEDHHAERH